MDFQEAHLISVEDIIIISKLGEKNLFLCRFNPIVTMLVLDNYDDEFAGRNVEVPTNTPSSTKMAAK